jgi:hypothetical protein
MPNDTADVAAPVDAISVARFIFEAAEHARAYSDRETAMELLSILTHIYGRN